YTRAGSHPTRGGDKKPDRLPFLPPPAAGHRRRGECFPPPRSCNNFPRHTFAPHSPSLAQTASLARALEPPYDGNSRRRPHRHSPVARASIEEQSLMATFLRHLRRNGSTEELPELRQLVERLESQQTNLERLVQ